MTAEELIAWANKVVSINRSKEAKRQALYAKYKEEVLAMESMQTWILTMNDGTKKRIALQYTVEWQHKAQMILSGNTQVSACGPEGQVAWQRIEEADMAMDMDKRPTHCGTMPDSVDPSYMQRKW